MDGDDAIRGNRSENHRVLFLIMRVSTAVFATCLFGFSTGAFGQPFSFGVVGGASLTEDFQNQIFDHVIAYSTPKRRIAGGMVEVRLPLHLSVEADGLYHELEFTTAFIEPNRTPNSVSPGRDHRRGALVLLSPQLPHLNGRARR